MNASTGWAAPILLAQQPEIPALDFWLIVKWLLILAIVFFGIFPGIVAYMVWAERKIAARFQDRIGPNRVGPLGLLQPIADALKLITKENIVPATADKVVHIVAPVMILVSAFLVLAVIPFGSGMVAINPPSGALYLIAVSSMSPLGIFLAGWSSRNKYSLLGAMRAVAQLVSYEVPQVLSIVPVILWTGSLSMVAIFDRQVEYGWFIFSPPGLLGFALLTIANIAEVNRAPFDLPEAESEIIAGYHTEYSGMRFGLFFLAEYLSVFGVSCLGTALFLGGGTLPPPFTNALQEYVGTYTTGSFLLTNAIYVPVFMAKVGLYIFFMFWVRATLPRLRVDRLMNFAWKFMVPLSVINVFIAAVWYEFVFRPGQPRYLIGWTVTGAMVIVSVVVMISLYRASDVIEEAEIASRPLPGRGRRPIPTGSTAR
ncbi:MAG: NADH-quinone oxidoreductase subunit NuoH [Isosphaeraceae bacterium]|nr:NADH-quinone oxidoreductase subunit NuoH [Isosphaeraceae bacterium]